MMEQNNLQATLNVLINILKLFIVEHHFFVILPTIKVKFLVTRSLVLCVCFVDRYLSFCTFSFGHCVVCSFTIYRF